MFERKACGAALFCFLEAPVQNGECHRLHPLQTSCLICWQINSFLLGTPCLVTNLRSAFLTFFQGTSVSIRLAAKDGDDGYTGVTPVSHCKRKQGVSSAEAVRMQSRSSARPLPFHTGSVCSARLNSVFCTEWANSNLILNTIGLDLLLE